MGSCPAWKRLQRTWLFSALVLVGTVQAASAQLVFDTNVLFDNIGTECSGSSGGADSCAATYSDCDVVNSIFPNNRLVDPQLNPDIAIVDAPRWNLLGTSPALGKNGAPITDAALLDPFFDDVCHVGAVGEAGNPADDWTTGWTWFGQDGCTPEVQQAENEMRPVVMVATDIAANRTFSADSVYVLVGKVSVLDGNTLMIEPGTLIVGEAVGSFLVVERGADIQALGTREAPIVFTSGAPCGQQLPGDWGGVVIHGKAKANCADLPPDQGGTGCQTTDANNTCVSEGGAGIFGESDDNDSSGTMRYCRIEYSGLEIAPNNELNCLTMNAVGRGTTLEYLQVHRGTDDGFEWFGGTAECKWLVATSVADDCLDWQMGWRGRVQYAVARQVSDDGGDKGIEADNNEFDNECPLESDPILSNLTLVGVSDLSGVGSAGINLRRGTNGIVVNSIVVGFTGNGLDIDSPATFNNCTGPVPPLYTCPTSAAGTERERTFVVTAGPNPTRGATTLSFDLPAESRVVISIYDAAGRLVDTILSERMVAGAHRVPWQPTQAAKGAYFYQVVAGAHKASGRILYLN